MLHVTVIAVGKLKEKFWAQACDEYLKRLKPYASVEVRELPDIDPAKAGGERKAVQQESQAILSAIPEGSVVCLLDIDGKLATSEDLAGLLDECSLSGRSRVCFMIGGSCGVDEEVRKAADRRISLGRITLPHNLARVVLLEQVYRAFKISRNEPYHK